MVKITNGTKTIAVSMSAFKSMYQPKGWTQIGATEKAFIPEKSQNDMVVKTVHTPIIPVVPPQLNPVVGADAGENNQLSQNDTEFIELFASMDSDTWGKDDVMQIVNLLNIDLQGVTKAYEIKEIVRDALIAQGYLAE